MRYLFLLLVLSAPAFSELRTGTNFPYGITGHDGASPPAAGTIGEKLESTNSVAAVNNVIQNLTSVTLTPGTWLVSGYVGFAGGGTMTAISVLSGGISTNPSAFEGSNVHQYFQENGVTKSDGATLQIGGQTRVPVPVRLFTVTSNTAVWLIVKANFGNSGIHHAGILANRLF